MHERPHVERAMRMAGWWAMLVVVLLACSGLAFSREIEATVTGTGEDESSALANALAKAVAQVNGVNSSMSVSTGKVEVTGRGSETIRTKDAETVTSTEGKVSVGQSADSRLQASGKVSRFEILSTETLPDARVSVTVKAFVHRYEAPVYNAPGSKVGLRRVAVFPGLASKASYDFFGAANGEELARELSARVEASVLDDRRLSVLDRTTLAASMAELGLIGSTLTGADEKAKLRQFRGADAIVLLEVRDAYHRVEHWRIKTTGQHQSAAETLFSVAMRVIVPATGEVLAIRDVSVRAAFGRDDALVQVADEISADLAMALTGVAPPRRVRDAVPIPAAMPEPQGPRRSGVSLPGDQR
jgi:hypothetical protein